jgi:hypothetical protein
MTNWEKEFDKFWESNKLPGVGNIDLDPSKEDIEAFIAKQRKQLLKEVRDGLENNVMVHSKYNFCDPCIKKMRWDFTMYDDKSLEKFLEELKDSK